MTEIHVRVLEADEWQTYKDVRLRALRESPEAFVASAEEEEAFGDDRWQQRMERSRRILASDGGADGTPGGAAAGDTAESAGTASAGSARTNAPHC